jgi:hypothetical protein
MGNRDTQILVEVLRTGAGNVRDTQMLMEVLIAGSPKVRDSQIILEVLMPRYPGNPASLQFPFYEFTQPT